MLADVVRYLRCPHCAADLTLADASLRCANGHSFDLARQGYVNLLPGGAHTGTADTQSMVEARERFLQGGHYDFIAQAVADAALRSLGAVPGCLLDIGAGTGFYLSRVLRAAPGRAGLALDLSKHALRRAARRSERLGAVVCDVWRPLPVRTAAAALALSVFAPRNPEETRRVLRPDGSLLVVTPAQRHLRELVWALSLLSVEEGKEERLRASLEGHFEAGERTRHETHLVLDHADVEALVMMGPSARHVAQDLDARIRHLPEPVGVTASVTLAVYHPRQA